MKTYLVGSRASNLAKVQVREYLAPLRERFPGVTFTHRVILEGGDKDRKSRLSDVSEISGGSVFSSEQEAALSRGDVDVVIHSLKDLPTANPPGLTLLPPLVVRTYETPCAAPLCRACERALGSEPVPLGELLSSWLFVRTSKWCRSGGMCRLA